MEELFASRMAHVHRSFIREILHYAADPKTISFAGGLPNPDLFPVREIEESCSAVLRSDGRDALQYSTTEGYLPLREYIARRYREKKNLLVDPDEILIITGSQQGIDLVAKVLIDERDPVVVERPGYLGAIQALSVFMPSFYSVPLQHDGIDASAFKEVCEKVKPKLFYTVPNFQNPSGITYSESKRREVSEILWDHNTLLLEDDPYGELRFMGEDLPSFRSFLGERAIIQGSFSKIITPSFRLGWICASKQLMEKLIIPKQAADLHTNYFCQRVIYHFLTENDVDRHIERICRAYGRQRDKMVEMIEQHFPEVVKATKPEGGMFIWLVLPEGISSMDLFELALKEHVAFVPGKPFYIDGGGENTLRLNFSNVDEETIEEGMLRLSTAVKRLLPSKFYATDEINQSAEV
jgi:2-aminoadipate transaminase